MMKAPPPLVAACTGKRKKLPSPTAEPATARITPSFEPQFSLLFDIFDYPSSLIFNSTNLAVFMAWILRDFVTQDDTS